jgi:hypothetical protein
VAGLDDPYVIAVRQAIPPALVMQVAVVDDDDLVDRGKHGAEHIEAIEHGDDEDGNTHRAWVILMKFWSWT